MAQGLMAMTGGGGDSMHTHSLCIRTRMSCLVKLPLPPDAHLSRLCSTLGSSVGLPCSSAHQSWIQYGTALQSGALVLQ